MTAVEEVWRNFQDTTQKTEAVRAVIKQKDIGSSGKKPGTTDSKAHGSGVTFIRKETPPRNFRGTRV